MEFELALDKLVSHFGWCDDYDMEVSLIEIDENRSIHNTIKEYTSYQVYDAVVSVHGGKNIYAADGITCGDLFCSATRVSDIYKEFCPDGGHYMQINGQVVNHMMNSRLQDLNLPEKIFILFVPRCYGMA